MNRTTVISNDAESELAAERGSVDEYVSEREKLEDNDMLAGLRELDGAATIKWECYRVGDIDTSRNGWVCDVPLEMLTMQHLSNIVGAGTYQVVGKYSNGRYAARRTIRIAGDAVRADKTARTSATPIAVTPSFNFEEWERRQEIRDERRRKERNELLAILVPSAAPIVAAIMGRQGPDLTALVTALKPPDSLQMIAALKQLSPQVEQNQPSAMDAAFKLIDKLRDMAPSEGGTSWLDVAKEAVRALGPVVGPVLEGAITRAQVVGPGTSPGAVPASTAAAGLLPTGSLSTAAVAGPIANIGDTAMNVGSALALLPWLRSQLDMAIRKASQGRDPGLFAEWMLDEIPSGVDPQELIAFVARADWWTALQQFEPRVAPHGLWFANMRKALLELATGVSSDAPQMTVDTAPAKKDEPDLPREPPKLGV